MQNRIIKNWKLLPLILAAGWLTGCANTRPFLSVCSERVKQYSIESYQGPFPLEDGKYVEPAE